MKKKATKESKAKKIAKVCNGFRTSGRHYVHILDDVGPVLYGEMWPGPGAKRDLVGSRQEVIRVLKDYFGVSACLVTQRYADDGYPEILDRESARSYLPLTNNAGKGVIIVFSSPVTEFLFAEAKHVKTQMGAATVVAGTSEAIGEYAAGRLKIERVIDVVTDAAERIDDCTPRVPRIESVVTCHYLSCRKSEIKSTAIDNKWHHTVDDIWTCRGCVDRARLLK